MTLMRPKRNAFKDAFGFDLYSFSGSSIRGILVLLAAILPLILGHYLEATTNPLLKESRFVTVYGGGIALPLSLGVLATLWYLPLSSPNRFANLARFGVSIFHQRITTALSFIFLAAILGGGLLSIASLSAVSSMKDSLLTTAWLGSSMGACYALAISAISTFGSTLLKRCSLVFVWLFLDIWLGSLEIFSGYLFPRAIFRDMLGGAPLELIEHSVRNSRLAWQLLSYALFFIWRSRAARKNAPRNLKDWQRESYLY